MYYEKRPPVFVGARTIKTGIAVTVALFLSYYIPYSLPLLAGVAAIICMQPSITAGVQKGLVRTKATILGGLFGLVLHYIFGYNIFVIGAGIIVVLWICRRLKWEDGISLASLTVIAVMAQVSGEALHYAMGRVISTLIGIIVATLTNIIVIPPRHQTTFRKEIRSLTASFPNLYVKVVEAYAYNRPDLAEQVRSELKDIQTEIASLRQKLKHLWVGTQIPLGTYLEGIELGEYLLFDRSVHYLVDVIAKLEDLVVITKKRYERRRELQEQGVISYPYYLSAEFADLMTVLQELAQKLGRLHECVFHVVAEQEIILMPQISQYAEDIHKLKELTRQRLKYWETEHIKGMDIFLLMSTHRVIFDLEEITTNLTDLAKAAVSSTTEKKGRGTEKHKGKPVGKN